MVPSRQMMHVICHQRHVTCLNTHMIAWAVPIAGLLEGTVCFFCVYIPVLFQDTDTLQLASLHFSHLNNVTATLS